MPKVRNKSARAMKIDRSKPVTLYLVRHGHYDLDDSYPAETGPPLSPLGRRQARRLARYLDRVRFDVIYVSTMRRAADTAEPVIARQPQAAVVRTGDLAEIQEGIIAPYRASPGAGRERRRVERFRRAIKSAHRPGANVLAVCHANVIRYILARALGADPKEGYRLMTHNTGISAVQYYKSGRTAFTVERINFLGHLCDDLVS